MGFSERSVGIRTLTYGALASLLLLDLALGFAGIVPSWITATIGVPVTLGMPGVLSVLLLGARRLGLKELLIGIGFSLIELIAIGLVVNFLPGLWHAQRPLDGPGIVIGFNILVAAQLVFLWIAHRKAHVTVPQIQVHWPDWVLILAALLLIACSIFGTFRLNNGASNMLSMAALGLGIGGIAITAIWHKRFSTASIVVFLYALAISILFLVSLRSWFITGHDIKTEYMVFTLAVDHGKWSMGYDPSAYNACLSITLMPVVLTKLLHVSGQPVFKVILQLIFAIAPLSVFVLVRRYASRLLAMLSAILFITFPTFTTDSPMLTRQEVAFVFFGLALIIWFAHMEAWLQRRWKLIFMVLSAGVVLSHYSSTYMYVAMVLIVCVMGTLYKVFFKRRRQTFALSWTMTLIILLGAFLWYAQTTQTSHGLTGIIKGSLTNLSTLFTQDNRDTAVNYSLVGIGSNNGQQLSEFIQSTQAEHPVANGNVINSLVFLSNTIPASRFVVSLSRALHVSIPTLINALYYGIVPRLYQICTVLGLVALLVLGAVRKRMGNMPLEYVFLGIAGVIMLGLQVVLPNISLNYGLLRAFQQCLMFLALPLLLSLYVIGNRIHRYVGQVAVTVFVLICALLFTNFLPQLTGGVPASLNLNNSGPYYGAHYTFHGDLVAYKWLQQSAPSGSAVRSVDPSSILAYDPAYPFQQSGILPFQVPQNSFVLFGAYEATHHAVYIDVAHNLLPVHIAPNDFPDKNQVYSNGEATILK